MAEAGGAYNLRARPMTAEVTGPAPVPLRMYHTGHWYCRVLSLSDCRYSLNPLNQTRID